jgi:peptide/nickel transport system permease protein
MIIKLAKQPQFMIGMLFILCLLVFSFFWNDILDVNKSEAMERMDFKYDKNGKIIDYIPFSPSEVPPFGTDLFGKQLFYQIIDGAKYTILIAFFIAFFRILFSVGITLLNPKANYSFLDDLVAATLTIPTTILAYLFMSSLLMKHALERDGFMELLVKQSIVLICIGIPPLISTFSREIRSILTKDYINNTFALGAKKPYVYYKHVLPELSTRLILLFAQQMIQVLILLAHLGVLAIFIGGSETLVLGDMFNQKLVDIPLAGEWAGIIGMSFVKLQAAPWVILIPLSCFAVTIFALNLIIQGIQNGVEETNKL